MDDSNESRCPVCKTISSTNSSESPTQILCSTCLGWFHGSCVNLSNEEICALGIQGNDWFCEECTQQSASQNVNAVTAASIVCPLCPTDSPKYFNSQRGLKIHKARKHKVPIFSNSHNINPNSSFLENITRLKSNVKILKRIPKGARNLAASKLSHVINAVVEKNDQSSWENLFLFSYSAFQVPPTNKSRSLTSIVKENISTSPIPVVSENARKNGKKNSTLESRTEAKVSEFDIKGAVRLLNSDDTIAPFNNDTFQALSQKHPSPSRSLNFPESTTESETLQTNRNEIQKAIFSFPNGSAAGIDGISPQILKDLISKSAADGGIHLLESITNLCNLMLSGKVIDTFTEYLYGANLCALNKKGGGVRPIAIGSCLRRLVAKIACNFERDVISDYLQPHQFGFGAKQGLEAVIHAVRTFVTHHKQSNFILVKIDYKNAFNSVERDSILNQVKLKTPEIFPFLLQSYQKPSLLFYGNKTLHSQVGAQQGDPAGPMLFSLSLHPTVLALSSELNVWYLDDGTLAGSPVNVIKDLEKLVSDSKDIGLEMNPSKCEVYYLSGVQDMEVHRKLETILPGIRVVQNSELELLGVPILQEAFKSHFDERLTKIKATLQKLKKLNSHVAYFLLKNCFAIPKWTYTLRTTPIWTDQTVLDEVDDSLKQILEEILNLNLNDTQWCQASLPIRVGGLGIRKLSDITLPTFLSSVHGVKSLVSKILNTPEDELDICFLSEAVDTWNLNYTTLPENKSNQKLWDKIIVDNIVNQKLNFVTVEDIARMKALQKPESGAWLQAIPSRQVGTFVDTRSFRVCVGLRLGCTLCRPHTCTCGEIVDSKGIHPLSCQLSKGRFPRHSNLNDILKRTLALVDIPSQLEPPGLSADNITRPDGVTIIPWSHGQNLVWDATCTDTLAPSNLPSTAANPAAAAEKACQLKHRKYQHLKDQNYIFKAVAVETMGPICGEAKGWLEDLGRLAIVKTGEPRAKNFIYQQISLAVQRGNAASILGAHPCGEGLENVFYI
ncbi:hypothetical protein M8J77_018338 [Diaphorina citri]|nr:hypothetical protein M8J77_018338 [Diaphorina citri]